MDRVRVVLQTKSRLRIPEHDFASNRALNRAITHVHNSGIDMHSVKLPSLREGYECYGLYFRVEDELNPDKPYTLLNTIRWELKKFNFESEFTVINPHSIPPHCDS